MTDTHWPDAAFGANLSDIGLITGAVGILAGRLLDRAEEQPIFAVAAPVGPGRERVLMTPRQAWTGDLL
jgi:hypothetical protein